MLADVHEETLRLAKLVEELLLLARADANQDTSLETHATRITAEGSRQHEAAEHGGIAVEVGDWPY